jgi:hypothetical protein
LTPKVSEHLSKRKIDPSRAGQRMLPVLERRDTVIDEARGTTPHGDITDPSILLVTAPIGG